MTPAPGKALLALQLALREERRENAALKRALRKTEGARERQLQKALDGCTEKRVELGQAYTDEKRENARLAVALDGARVEEKRLRWQLQRGPETEYEKRLTEENTRLAAEVAQLEAAVKARVLPSERHAADVAAENTRLSAELERAAHQLHMAFAGHPAGYYCYCKRMKLAAPVHVHHNAVTRWTHGPWWCGGDTRPTSDNDANRQPEPMALLEVEEATAYRPRTAAQTTIPQGKP